jgi:hypothetical protein
MKYMFWHNGDASVGMRSEYAHLELDEIGDDELQKELIENIRQSFEDAWDFKTYVDELEDIRAAEKEEAQGFRNVKFRTVDLDNWLEQEYEERYLEE